MLLSIGASTAVTGKVDDEPMWQLTTVPVSTHAAHTGSHAAE